MTLQEIEAYGQSWMSAMLAGIDAVDATRHIPLLKDSIELTIDRVAAAEHSYFDVLAECVLLASQNMQDVRLHDLERRMERVENPEAPPLSEMLIETAIVLAVEMVVVMGSAWLAGPALVFIGARSLARSSRVNTLAVKQGAYQYQLRQQLWRERFAAVNKVVEAKRRVNARDMYEPMPLNVLEDAVYDATRLLAETEKAVQLMQQTSASAAVDAYKNALATRTVRMKSKPLRDFLSGASGHTIKGRIGESSGQQLSKLLSHAMESDSGPLREAPFLSSTVVGEILSRLREAQLEAQIGHQFSRVYVRSLPDDSFATDSMAQEIARAAFDAQVPLDGALAIVDVVRPVLVRGFEALLWYEWLNVTGALWISTGRKFETGRTLEVGDLYQGHIVTEFRPSMNVPGPGEASARSFHHEGTGDLYHGVRKVTEHQAKYLYDTFAAPYFMIPENASLLPFKNPFDPNRYAEVLEMSPRATREVLTNAERSQRLDEMRVLVVIFFTAFFGSRRAKASYGAISDLPVLLDDYLNGLPDTNVQVPTETCEPAPEQLASYVDAILDETGRAQRFDIQWLTASFETHLTQLEQRLWMYELVHSQTPYEAAEAPDGLTVGDAIREIKALQRQVEAEYSQVIELRALTDSAKQFQTEFEARLRKLVDWQVDEAAPAQRRFP